MIGSRTPALILASVAGFTLAMGVAVTGYPGGTWIDRTSVGHSFWGNFACDLLRTTALDGRPNAYPRVAAAGMLVLLAGLVALWFAVPRLFANRRRLGLAVRVLGTVAALAMLAVPFTPADRHGALHGLAVTVATVPGLLVAALTTAGMLAAKGGVRSLGVLGAVTVAASFADSLLLYARGWVETAPFAILLPALERVSLLFLLAWMTATALTLAGQRFRGMMGE